MTNKILSPPVYWDLDNVLVADVETDGFSSNTIHCMVFSDLQGNETIIEQPLENPAEEAKLFSLLEGHGDGTIAGHYFLGFDFDVFEKFYPGLLQIDQVL